MTDFTAYKKSRIALYYFMLGRRYYLSCKAMNYAEKLHDGTRKDNITPEFSHQVWIANSIRTLEIEDHIMETTLAVAFLHDTSEDKEVSFEEIKKLFNLDIADGVERMTKKFRGHHVEPDVYFQRLAETPVSAIVKGVDRLHNLSSMIGVFSFEKQIQYMEETKERHIPMLKKARKNFPKYESSFENIKQSLQSRITLIEAIHNAKNN